MVQNGQLTLLKKRRFVWNRWTSAPKRRRTTRLEAHRKIGRREAAEATSRLDRATAAEAKQNSALAALEKRAGALLPMDAFKLGGARPRGAHRDVGGRRRGSGTRPTPSSRRASRRSASSSPTCGASPRRFLERLERAAGRPCLAQKAAAARGRRRAARRRARGGVRGPRGLTYVIGISAILP